MCFMQYEEAKTELLDLKEKYEKIEQEKQSLAGELEECKSNMKDLQEKGTKVSAGLSYTFDTIWCMKWRNNDLQLSSKTAA